MDCKEPRLVGERMPLDASLPCRDRRDLAQSRWRCSTGRKVGDETYARAKKVFKDQQIADLTAVAGNYVMVAMLLAMASETVPPDKQEPFKPGASRRAVSLLPSLRDARFAGSSG